MTLVAKAPSDLIETYAGLEALADAGTINIDDGSLIDCSKYSFMYVALVMGPTTQTVTLSAFTNSTNADSGRAAITGSTLVFSSTDDGTFRQMEIRVASMADKFLQLELVGLGEGASASSLTVHVLGVGARASATLTQAYPSSAGVTLFNMS
jgi:hypothetical protein